MKPAPFFPKFKRPSEALAAAKRLIRNAKRWVTSELAVYHDDYDNELVCKTTSKQAEAFCALGALQQVDGPVFRSARAYLREAAKQYLTENEPNSHLSREERKPADDHIFHINDSYRHGHEAVMDMFKRAVKAAKKDGK